MDDPWFKARQAQENFSHLQSVHTNCGVQPASFSEGSRVLSQGKKQSENEMYHLPALALRSRMSAAILHVFMVWSGTALPLQKIFT
jgi:hypothetical protein